MYISMLKCLMTVCLLFNLHISLVLCSFVLSCFFGFNLNFYCLIFFPSSNWLVLHKSVIHCFTFLMVVTLAVTICILDLASLVAQTIKNLDLLQFSKNYLEKAMAPHSSNSCLENPMDGGA